MIQSLIQFFPSNPYCMIALIIVFVVVWIYAPRTVFWETAWWKKNTRR